MILVAVRGVQFMHWMEEDKWSANFVTVQLNLILSSLNSYSPIPVTTTTQNQLNLLIESIEEVWVAIVVLSTWINYWMND